jgi:transposase-like protein
MESLRNRRRQVNGQNMLAEAMAVGQAALAEAVSHRLNEMLLAAVTLLLGREFHVRRMGVALGLEQSGRCHRCKSHQSRRFSRNGYRPRGLLTPLGWILFLLPRVRCECGGSVQIDLSGFVRPYQRISDEVDEQIRRWYHLGMSLRNIEKALAHGWMTPLSLRTLMVRIHQMAEEVKLAPPSQVPPIVQLDAIWVTMVLPTGGTYRDRKGRKRPRVGRFRYPILVALGVWPDTECSRVLDWIFATSEDELQWTAFLSRLYEQGIHHEQGLQLVIHDGGGGLCAALRTVHFAVPTQRCLFHKLRNIANAIQLPTGLSRRQRRRRRKAILKPFREIWQAKRYSTALRRYLQVVRRFRDSQPAAVATLRRDFRHTVAFYSLIESYDTRFLRTTSRLERLNRTLRTQFRKANAYHSRIGATAAIAQQVALFNA